jgi:preprotein translocase subunit SecB
MAKAKKETKATKVAASTPAQTPQTPQAAPSVVVNAQYIKDLSFENPLNPIVLSKLTSQPKLDVSLDIKVNTIEQDRYEVVLHISAKTVAENKTLFLTEIAYAGLVTIRNMPPQNLESALLVYVPSLLFPFARRILADTTREGSLPPLFLDPIDFATLYVQRKNKMN